MNECYEISKFALEQKDFYNSALWMREILTFPQEQFLSNKISIAEVKENMLLSMANYFIMVFHLKYIKYYEI